MKKLTAMLLTLSFAFMIVGCSEETKAPKKDAGATKAPAGGEKKDK
jgi:hypothetical protein